MRKCKKGHFWTTFRHVCPKCRAPIENQLKWISDPYAHTPGLSGNLGGLFVYTLYSWCFYTFAFPNQNELFNPCQKVTQSGLCLTSNIVFCILIFAQRTVWALVAQPTAGYNFSLQYLTTAPAPRGHWQRFMLTTIKSWLSSVNTHTTNHELFNDTSSRLLVRSMVPKVNACDVLHKWSLYSIPQRLHIASILLFTHASKYIAKYFGFWWRQWHSRRGMANVCEGVFYARDSTLFIQRGIMTHLSVVF